MPSVTESTLKEMRRDRADWMKPVDDEIMEVLEEDGAGTPESLSEEIGKNNDYIGRRCRELVSYGLLERVSRGLYRLTEAGDRYLSGELDASSLNGVEE